MKFNVTKNYKFAFTFTPIILVILLATGVLFVNRGYQHKLSYLSGDEPHYIMMAQAFNRDGNFNLKPSYENDWSSSYYPGPSLFPAVAPIINLKSNKWYSIHTIGLPVLISLPYKFFGVIGVRVWIIVLQLLSFPIFYFLFKKYLGPKRALVGLLLMVSCSLLWQNIGGIYPSMLLITISGIILLLFNNESALWQLLLMLLFFLAELIQTKGFVLLAPIIIANSLLLIRKYKIMGWIKKYWASISFIIIGNLWYLYFLYQQYHVISPTQLYGKNGQLFTANPVINSIAILTDRNKGLIIYFPLLIIAGPFIWRGIIDLYVYFKRIYTKKVAIDQTGALLIGTLVGLLVLLFTQLTFEDWSGSVAPNGRYMLAFIMLFIFMVSKYANFKNSIEKILIIMFVVLGGLISVYTIANIIYYISPGVNSFIVVRHTFLMHFPIFPQNAKFVSTWSLKRGYEIVILLLLINAFLVCALSKHKKLVRDNLT